jgi:hypothetical protein
MMAHQTEEPEPIRDTNADVPEALEGVIARLMTKAPEDRFPSMADAVKALQGSLAGLVPPKVKPRQSVTPNPGKPKVNSSAPRKVVERAHPAAPEKPPRKLDSAVLTLIIALVVAGATGIGGVVVWLMLLR